MILPPEPPHRGGPPAASPREIVLESVERRRGRRWRYGLGAAALSLLLAAGAWGLGARAPSEDKTAVAEKAAAQKAEVVKVAMQSELDALRGEVQALRSKLDASEKHRRAEEARAVEAAVGVLDKKIASTRAETTAATAELSAKLEKASARVNKLEAAKAAATKAAAKAEEKAAAKAEAKAEPKTEPKSEPKAEAKQPNIDETPVGSIPLPPTRPKAVAEAQATQARRPMAGYVLRGARHGAALVEAHGEIFDVRPGDLLPGAGRVIVIERRADGWAVVAEHGEVVGLREPRQAAFGPGRYYPEQGPYGWQ
jgi:hypothetical protein